MKKSLMILGMLAVGFANAQQGNVGINTTEPKGTLEVQPNAENAQTEATTNEGIIAPRLSKTRIANIANPIEGTLVYATDETTSPISAYTGGNTKVAKITEKGYYFYNGTEWVKAGNGITETEWVYDPTTKQINLKRNNTGSFTSNVHYDSETGRFINVDAEQVMREANLLGDDFTSNLVTEGASFNVSHLKADKIKTPYTHNPNYYYSSKDESFLQVTNESIKPELHSGGHYANKRMYTYTDATNTKNFGALSGNVSYAIHRGSGYLSNGIFGISGTAMVKNGSTNAAAGILGYSAIQTNSKVKMAMGGYLWNVLGKEGKNINVDFAISARIHNDIVDEGTIENLISIDASNRHHHNFKETAKKMKITNIYGLKYQGFSHDFSFNTAPQNHYGIYIDNINAANNNYSIYSNNGLIRFGDLKHSGTTNVAGSGDRPVYVTADGILKIGNPSTALSSRIWQSDGNNIKLAIKADGSDRVDNVITINDEGQLLATSFRGKNGVEIFPDYVFQKYYTGASSIKSDYNFKSLSQVEDFVKANGHLPGYKSAETIKAQGYVDLMETQLTNVEKIEELYLHSIEQDKALKAKDAEIAELKQRLERLEKLIK